MIKLNEQKEKSIKELINEFMDFKITQGSSDLTLRDYTKTFKQWESFDFDFMQYLKSKSGESPARFNIPYSNINALYNWCVLQEYIPNNPLLKSGLKKVRDDGKIRTASIEDIHRLLKVMDLETYTGIRDYTICLLMLDCGIRPKEIFGLTIDSYNQDSIIISKKVAKTRQERVVPISKVISIQIEKIIDLKSPEWKNDYIFCSYEGEQMHDTMLSKRLLLYSHLAKIKITPYDLRHTFATMYLNNQGNVFSLQKIMGHSDLRMTKRYIAISSEQLIEQHKTISPINNILVDKKRVIKNK